MKPSLASKYIPPELRMIGEINKRRYGLPEDFDRDRVPVSVNHPAAGCGKPNGNAISERQPKEIGVVAAKQAIRSARIDMGEQANRSLGLKLNRKHNPSRGIFRIGKFQIEIDGRHPATTPRTEASRPRCIGSEVSHSIRLQRRKLPARNRRKQAESYPLKQPNVPHSGFDSPESMPVRPEIVDRLGTILNSQAP